MPFSAKAAAPQPAHATLRHPILDRAAEGGITLFAAPPGYLLTSSLAAALATSGRSTLWLRTGPEDCDPATFLLSLIASARRLSSAIGQATLEQMQRRPGPISGWPPLFAHLAQELTEALPAPSALVLEHCHHLNDTHPTLRLLGAHFLPRLPAHITCILTSDHALPQAVLPAHTVHRGIKDLRFDVRTALALIEPSCAGLPTGCIERIVSVTEGRGVALAGLCEASAALGPALIQQATERANQISDLLSYVARAWLAAADAGAHQALALALRLGYSHPALFEATLGHTAPPPGPWLQPLADGWARLRRVWHTPLRAALRAGATPAADSLRRAADYLALQDAVEQAVSLYFDLGKIESAAQVIASALDQLMNLGQWETLGGWLDRLPTPALRAWPWLVYAGGELAAAQGDIHAARRAFAVAAALFTAQHDADGTCQSLLAESVLATWQGDRAHARASALAARAMAEATHLAWHQGWSAWQLGCLAAGAGDLDDAVAYFDRAATAAAEVQDPAMLDLLLLAKELALHQRDLHRQRELHRHAYFAIEPAEREAAERLHQMLSAPPESLDALLGVHGWSRTPLMLKLPSPPTEIPAEPERTGLWGTLLHAIGLRCRSTPPAAITTPTTSPRPLDVPLPPPLALAPGVTHPALSAAQASFPSPAVKPSAGLTLTAHLLGTFRVTLNDQPVESWPSGRGRAVFKYLLTHRERPIPRDVLMDIFWPEAEPETARNNLNVTLHRLRQALRTAASVPVVIFQDGVYDFNPDLHLWLDVDEFERHFQAGRQLEAAGQLGFATTEYELATGLYQGDFPADDPYEDWAILAREHLRVAYLDTLDRLSHIHFNQGRYAVCATLCQLILARDNCREDTHRLLMRCYSRQDQHHLALRQYQACVEALRAELDVAPAPATTQLCERIRRRERV